MLPLFRVLLPLLMVLRSSTPIFIVPRCTSHDKTRPARAFSTHRPSRTPNCHTMNTRVRSRQFSSENNNNDHHQDHPREDDTNYFDMDELLDTPFFEPDKVLEDESSSPLLKTFASFVVNDYAQAEAVLAGFFFVVLIVVAQEFLRMQLYGADYAPFSRGVLPGNLF